MVASRDPDAASYAPEPEDPLADGTLGTDGDADVKNDVKGRAEPKNELRNDPRNKAGATGTAGKRDRRRGVVGGALSGVLTGFAPIVIVGLAALLATEWSNWLHAGTLGDIAVAPAAGVVLAALLLLSPARWPGPLLAAATAVAAVDLRHDLGTGISMGRAIATVVGALVAALILRFLAGGHFRLAGVRELMELIAAAAVGGIFSAAAMTLALLGTGTPLWRAGYHHALADAFGMILLPCVALTCAAAAPSTRRRGGRVEAGLLGLAVIGTSVLALGRWGDPLAYSATLLLVWAALRFGARGVALSGLVMVMASDWAAARMTGPFTGISSSPESGVLVLQVFIAVTLVAMLGLALALDERDAAEANNWIADERFRRAFNDSPSGMVVATLDGHIVEVNRALCERLGYSEHELLGTTLRALRHDDAGDLEPPRAWPTGPESPDLREQRFVDAQGETVWVELFETRLRRFDGAPEFKMVVIQDVTERKGLQQQLVHAQKMESVGRLAGGIAHDFNNVLSIMRGQVELLQDDLVVLDQARARIDSVQRATDRAAALTDDLMAFSRRRTDEPVPLDVRELVLSLRELLHQMLGPTVSLDLELDDALPTILADPNRIEQSILNLANNARDAMPSGGRLTVGLHSGPGPTRAVVLSVADTGAGMDAATLARVFEPFFTTKPPGLGTGLGLSTTEDMVRSAGGTIDVESIPGRGTTFSLAFPTYPPVDLPVPEPEGDARPVDDRDDDILTATATELDLTDPAAVPDPDDDAVTVLVVDDEPEVRTLVTEILRGSGYRVMVATDGEAALELISRERPRVDLLVTDVVMPVMSGTDLAVRMTERSPDMRVLFMSGFVPAGSAALRGAPLIPKPLRRVELLDAVQALLVGASDRVPRPAQGSKR